MPRPRRCVLPAVPCHITQRGVDRRETFSSDTDRRTYLRLLQQELEDTAVRVLGWCLMTNHVHLIALPLREDSLAESILLLRSGAGSSLDRAGLRGEQPGARRNRAASRRLRLVECRRTHHEPRRDRLARYGMVAEGAPCQLGTTSLCGLCPIRPTSSRRNLRRTTFWQRRFPKRNG